MIWTVSILNVSWMIIIQPYVISPRCVQAGSLSNLYFHLVKINATKKCISSVVFYFYCDICYNIIHEPWKIFWYDIAHRSEAISCKPPVCDSILFLTLYIPGFKDNSNISLKTKLTQQTFHYDYGTKIFQWID